MKHRSIIGVTVLALSVISCAPQPEPAASGASAPEAAVPAEPASENTMSLAGTTWLVDEIAGERIVTPADARQPFMEFNAAEHAVHGFLGCNTFRGSYESNGASLTFGALASTRMACPGDRDKIEFAMNQALPKVTGFAIEGNRLTLSASDGAALIRATAKKT